MLEDPQNLAAITASVECLMLIHSSVSQGSDSASRETVVRARGIGGVCKAQGKLAQRERDRVVNGIRKTIQEDGDDMG